jgi:hypothetical protein
MIWVYHRNYIQIDDPYFKVVASSAGGFPWSDGDVNFRCPVGAEKLFSHGGSADGSGGDGGFMRIKKEFSLVLLAIGFQHGMLFGLQASPNSKPPTSKGEPESKRVYTNEDLEQIPPHAGMNLSSKSAPARGAAQANQNAKTTSSINLEHYADRNGHGREYWHKQSQSLRDKLESVNREIESLEKQKKELSGSRGIHVTRSGGFRASGDLSHVETRLTSCQREKGQLQRQVEQMEEDARKAEALPEWLR